MLIMKLGFDFTKGDGIFLIYGNTYSLDLYMELLQSKHKKKKMKTSNLRKKNTTLNEDNTKTNYVSSLKNCNCKN